jgi:prepilin-type N-terminal cleavage/methylation domain-containing protein
MIESERKEGRARAPRGAAGFTLLELLAVIAIIAILSAILIGVGRRAAESGKAARAKAELAALSSALDAYRRAYGDYPQTDDEARLLQSLVGKKNPAGNDITGRVFVEAAKFAMARPATPSVPADPLTDPAAVLLDPWGQPYVYVYKVPLAGWTNPSFVLYSIGPDGLDTPVLLAGGLIDVAPPANADNVYANRY